MNIKTEESLLNGTTPALTKTEQAETGVLGATRVSVRGIRLEDPFAGIAASLANQFGIAPITERPSLEALATGMGNFVRHAINQGFEHVAKKQVTFAHAVSENLKETAGQFKELSSVVSVSSTPSTKSKLITQPYVASILKTFLPSFERLAAMASALRLTPSAIVRAGEISCALNGGRPLTGEMYPWSRSLYESIRARLSTEGTEMCASWREICSPWVTRSEANASVRVVFSHRGVGWSVYELRKMRNLSQLDLSRIQVESGKSRAKVQFGTAISQIERGEYNPSWPHLLLLAEMLQTSASSIFIIAELCTYEWTSAENSEDAFDQQQDVPAQLRELWSRLNIVHSAAIRGDESAKSFLQCLSAWPMAKREEPEDSNTKKVGYPV